jgi:hypothetical protein
MILKTYYKVKKINNVCVVLGFGAKIKDSTNIILTAVRTSNRIK